MDSGNKYNARKRVCSNGHLHDSRKEAKRCDELTILELEGKITELKNSVKFELVPAQYREVLGKRKCVERAVTYIADFTYYEDGKMVVEDVKGYKAGQAYSLYKLKRKLMLFKYGLDIREV